MRTPTLVVALSFSALASSALGQGQEIPHKKVVLDNGLQVILHEDHSDPLVSVYVSYHVGSGREEPGRSGFAHLFEHMLFQGSQHVGDDQHFKMVSEAGGTLNGTTNLDRTLYFETLPSNHLELALWLEADRMGFLLPAVTQEKLDNQRDVVKNERRQNYENRPYAQSSGVIAAGLYPADHPYSWVTIGSMKDLSAASLEDVHNFFRRWYGPNNATLGIGGDIDPEKTIALVKKYFGSIPRGPEVVKPVARAAVLPQSKRLVMEDKVQLPQLQLVWPGVPAGSAEEPALDMLASVLSQGKSSILEKALRIDETLVRNVSARNESSEVAGQFAITMTAAAGVSLDTLEQKVMDLLHGLETNGVSAEALDRHKAIAEAASIRRMETVASKTSSLTVNNMFYGEPNHAATELREFLEVTPKQVASALRVTILGKPYIALSVVPNGKIELAASGRVPEQVAQEKGFDRTKRPTAGDRPSIKAPEVWHDTLANGVKMIGAKYNEIPLTTLSIAVPAGRLSEDMTKLGLASLTAAMLNEGTQKMSTVELSDALEGLGATLNVGSDDDEITFNLSVINKNLKPAVEILRQVVLTPRFDAKDLARLKKQRLIAIDTRGDDIRGISSAVWQRLMFGDAAIEGMPAIGRRDTVEKITIDDVRNYYTQNATPAGARVSVVSDMSAAQVKDLLQPLVAAWTGSAGDGGVGAGLSAGVGGARPKAKDAAAARPSVPTYDKVALFLVDKPGAAQSEVSIGHLGVAVTDPDYYPLTVLNYVLGGAFSSRINMNLRESKGYTYGARSGFSAGVRPGPFAATGGIHTQYTKESVVEFMKELNAILDGVTDKELEFAKNALAQGLALRYESTMARMQLLNDIGKYGFPDDYLQKRLKQLDALTVDDLKALAKKHLHPDKMAILVVGDKQKVQQGLNGLGYGDAVELDIDGTKK
jgi:zinc protease